MKTFLKWTGIVLGSLLLILVGSAFYLNHASKSRRAKTYSLEPQAIAIPTDSAAIAAGKKWTRSLCIECHGDNLEGKVMLESPDLGAFTGPNLTSGKGGIGGNYADLDWQRAIRHGISNQGRPLLIMPAKEFNNLSDEHLGQIIAYLKTMPPIDNDPPKTTTTFMCNILMQLGAFGDILNAETIDHKSPSHYAPARAVSAEYGAYLVKINGCRTCHGPELNGGKSPDPEAPMAPNLTPGGNLPAWGADGFLKTLRTGATPMGKEINPQFMAWNMYGNYEDDQLQAIYAYLMSQPKLETPVLE